MARLPLPRPSDQTGNFFDGLIDKVTGTFDELVDLGLGALEFKLAESLISDDLASNPTFGGPSPTIIRDPIATSSGNSLNDMLPVIAIAGGLALVVVLLVKK